MLKEDGVAKGLRTILKVRGINTVNMHAEDMKTILSNQDNFEKTVLEHFLHGRGHFTFIFDKIPL